MPYKLGRGPLVSLFVGGENFALPLGEFMERAESKGFFVIRFLSADGRNHKKDRSIVKPKFSPRKRGLHPVIPFFQRCILSRIIFPIFGSKLHVFSTLRKHC